MRRDMGKVITERPREGSHWRSKKYGGDVPWSGFEGDYDAEPQRVPASRGRQYGYDGKTFTDVLGPIRRFLDKQVGRPWDRVHSELCAVLDRRKVTHAHVFTHIYQYVERQAVRDGRGAWRDRVHGRPLRRLFVHPGTGLLCRPRRIIVK